MALSGDTALVGTEGDDVGANTNQGSVYVFTRSGTAWTQQAQLTASDGAAEDSFGNSAALSGDGTALVGAYADDVSANSDQGAVYFYNALPVVTSITRVDPNPISATSVRFAATFSEDVTGVDAADFCLTTSGASVIGVGGSGTAYTITVSIGAGGGTLKLDVPNTAAITDMVGNPLWGLPYTDGEAYTVLGKTYLPLVLRDA